MAIFLGTQRPEWAVICYGIALMTDALDGAVARQRARATRWGSRFDPTVDKVLHGVLFIAFLPSAPALLGALLVVDGVLLVLGLLLVFRSQNVSASAFGKWKFVVQALACLGLFWNRLSPLWSIPSPLLTGVFVLALVCAVFSVIGYAQRFAFHPQRPVHYRAFPDAHTTHQHTHEDH
jgi:phosphatidylglycerophosphate synthase